MLPGKNNMNKIADDIWMFDSGLPGPRVTVLGGVHGNEKPGIEVVEDFKRHDWDGVITRGSFTFGIGNPAAVLADVRYPEGDFDLNRSFGTVPTEHQHSIAVARAEVLKPILAATDLLIDIHATLKPARPITLSPNPSLNPLLRKLLPLFRVKTVITGKALAEDASGKTTDAYVYEHGGIGITLETGWMGDTAIVPRSEGGIMAALKVMGVAPNVELEHTIPIALDMFDAYWSVPASADFVFTTTWENFSLLPKGTHFATDTGKKLLAPEDSYVIFPKVAKLLRPGTEACLLLRKV